MPVQCVTLLATKAELSPNDLPTVQHTNKARIDRGLTLQRKLGQVHRSTCGLWVRVVGIGA